MTAEQVLAKVRRLELRARTISSHLAAGAFRSAFRGRGMEFQSLRNYVPGDDTRLIDWNVTARFGRPHVKLLAEEREQTFIFVVDVSSSIFFQRKRETLAEAFAVLAFSAAHNDQAGLILFADGIELYVKPTKGAQHAARLLREVLIREQLCKGTGLRHALEFLRKVCPRRAFVFLLSDFLATGFEPDLRSCAKLYDLVAISTFEAAEEKLPDCGLIEFQDPETGARHLIDTGNPHLRHACEVAAAHRSEELSSLFRSAGIDHLRLRAGSDLLPQLAGFLRAHAKRR